jgi:hypothetical protein
MDSVLTLVKVGVQKVLEAAARAKANKKQCARLAERCSALRDALVVLPQREGGAATNVPVLQQVVKCLGQAEDLCNRVGSMGRAKAMVRWAILLDRVDVWRNATRPPSHPTKRPWLPVLQWKSKSSEEEFSELAQRLDNLGQALQLSVAARTFVDAATDKADLEADLSELKDMLQEAVDAGGKVQSSLDGLRIRGDKTDASLEEIKQFMRAVQEKLLVSRPVAVAAPRSTRRRQLPLAPPLRSSPARSS